MRPWFEGRITKEGRRMNLEGKIVVGGCAASASCCGWN